MSGEEPKSTRGPKAAWSRDERGILLRVAITVIPLHFLVLIPVLKKGLELDYSLKKGITSPKVRSVWIAKPHFIIKL